MLWPHLPWLDKATVTMRHIDYPSFSRCPERPPLFLQEPHISDLAPAHALCPPFCCTLWFGSLSARHWAQSPSIGLRTTPFPPRLRPVPSLTHTFFIWGKAVDA